MERHVPLVSMDASRKIDLEAINEWDFNTHALIEAAAQACQRAFLKNYPGFFNTNKKIAVFAGTGNNGADALSILRCMILEGLVQTDSSIVIISRFPDPASPLASIYNSLKKMQVPFIEWDKSLVKKPLLVDCDIIIDGIAGTGVQSALTGNLLEMTEKINAEASSSKLVVSVDVPSGLYDNWTEGEPIVNADYTLAIEPLKHCLYKPKSRASAGTIVFTGNIFPQALIDSHIEHQQKCFLVNWDRAKKEIPCFKPDIHKYQRGTIEIHAGSQGMTGAAILAARASQAAGAGLVRLIVDNEIYPIAASGLAAKAAGIMVSANNTEKCNAEDNRFVPDSILLGSGWGRAESRIDVLHKALDLEKKGMPLVLDADAIFLARDFSFSGNTLLTPHIGEFAVFTGLDKKQIENNPIPILLEIAGQKNAYILLKSHVMYIASPDKGLGIIDGMVPGLACGGTGDLLAGFCASLAGRMSASGHLTAGGHLAASGKADLFACAAAAASLLIQAGKDLESKGRIPDPLEIADQVADLAGSAWIAKPAWLN